LSAPTVVVAGSLDQVLDKLELVEQICSERESAGFSSEELEFVYEFVATASCCRHCEALDGSTYRGPFILSEFPFAVQVGDGVWLVGYHPNCQCILRLVNKVEGAVELLYKDLVVVEG
jgi:hypothetical protein